MDAAISLWNWLFVARCGTSADLLALSFAINAIFTGVSFTRFNLCAKVRKMAVDCINATADDEFLARIERLCKSNPEISENVRSFSDRAESYRSALQSEPVKWEWTRRTTTIAAALASFLWIAFDPNSRIGLVLALPYPMLLLFHFIRSLYRAMEIKLRFLTLSNSLDNADKKELSPFEIKDCISQLKNTKSALSKQQKTKSNKKK